VRPTPDLAIRRPAVVGGEVFLKLAFFVGCPVVTRRGGGSLLLYPPQGPGLLTSVITPPWSAGPLLPRALNPL